MVNDDRRNLAKILVHRSYLRRKASEAPFKLASGKTSDFYFDCQRTTRFAEAMPLIGRIILRTLQEEGISVEAVGGLAQGADPIAQAVAHSSCDMARQTTVNSFSVRKQAKSHGTQQWIEGCAPPGATVAIVDDVVTTGGSVLKAIERCKAENLKIVRVIVLVDRQDSENDGLESIRNAVPGVKVSAIFTKRELDEIDAREHGGTPHP